MGPNATRVVGGAWYGPWAPLAESVALNKIFLEWGSRRDCFQNGKKNFGVDDGVRYEAVHLQLLQWGGVRHEPRAPLAASACLRKFFPAGGAGFGCCNPAEDGVCSSPSAFARVDWSRYIAGGEDRGG